MNITVDTKFSLGDKLYDVYRTRTFSRKKCHACDGKGIIEIDGNKYQCITCNGTGKIEKMTESSFAIDELTICEIRLNRNITIPSTQTETYGDKDETFIMYGISRKGIKEKHQGEFFYLTEQAINSRIHEKNIFHTLKAAQNKVDKSKKK